METQPNLILSLRIWSSFAEHNYITELMQVEEALADKIGPPKKVRERGSISPNRQSWSLKILRQQEPDIDNAISEANNWVAKRAAAFQKLRAEGKRFEYYISVWVYRNIGMALDIETLKFLLEHEIGIGLDIYPPDR